MMGNPSSVRSAVLEIHHRATTNVAWRARNILGFDKVPAVGTRGTSPRCPWKAPLRARSSNQNSRRIRAMKWIVSTLATALALSASVAFAQTTNPSVSAAPSAQSSGVGIAGQPGGKNGPTAKPGDTVGSSNGMQQNTTVQQQDTSKVKGLPGNKSGPAAERPDRR